MAEIGAFERRKLEKLLGMGEGYVLNFSDRTYAEFFLDFRVDICGFHAIRPPSPLSSGQAFHGHLATCSTAIRPGSRSAATQGLHC